MLPASYVVGGHYSQSRERLWRNYSLSFASGLLKDIASPSFVGHSPLLKLTPIIDNALQSWEGSLLPSDTPSLVSHNTAAAEGTLDSFLESSNDNDRAKSELPAEPTSFSPPGAYPTSPVPSSRSELADDVDTSDRIPYASKEKWRAEETATAPPVDTSTVVPDETTQAQLDVDAELAAKLQSEEDAKSGGFRPRFASPARNTQQSPFMALLNAFFSTTAGNSPSYMSHMSQDRADTTGFKVPAFGVAGPSGTSHEPTIPANSISPSATGTSIISQHSVEPLMADAPRSALVSLQPTNDEDSEMDLMYGED